VWFIFCVAARFIAPMSVVGVLERDESRSYAFLRSIPAKMNCTHEE